MRGSDVEFPVAKAVEDPNELVRETAVAAARHILEIAEADVLEEDEAPAASRARARSLGQS